jgi:predicted dehydrogenase
MSHSNPVNAGVIGVGSMGRNHARVYDELSNTDLVGVSDADGDQADRVAAEHDTRSTSRNSLLAAADVVSVAVPTPYHYETAMAAVDRGVDVLVEKPLVSDPENGRALIDAARRQGVTVQVGHVERFNPAVRALDDVVSDLDVIAVEAQRLGPPRDREIQDSAVLDLMTHDIDVLLALVDADVETLHATGVRDNRHATATFEFGDGTMATLTASRVTQQKIRRLAITAEEARVNVDYASRSVEIHRHSMPEFIAENGDLRYRHESIVERPTVHNGEPLRKEIESFVAAATTGAEPVVTAEDGLRVLEIAREIDALAAGERSKTEVRPT